MQRIFFLTTGVISASFRLLGKFPGFNISLKKLCKTSTEAFVLIFNILDEIVSIVAAFLGLISWTSFSISNLDIAFKVNFS